MRSTWKGNIVFGSFTVPVNLYTATRDSSVRFRNLCPEHLVPLEYKKWCSEGNREIDYHDIKKGVDVEGEFVVIEQEELTLLNLEATHIVDIEKFVDGGEISPMMYNGLYYVSPDKGGERTYALLREMLAETGAVGIGRITMRNREHIVGIRSYLNGIVLFTLRYADEIVDITQVIPAELPEPTEGERQAARTLLEKMSSTLDLSEYKDQYRKAVEELVENKLKGRSQQKD